MAAHFESGPLLADSCLSQTKDSIGEAVSGFHLVSGTSL